jgi:hypothetical protein
METEQAVFFKRHWVAYRILNRKAEKLHLENSSDLKKDKQ